MRHYKVTEDLRSGINNFLGMEYINENHLGDEIDHLENYEKIARVTPEKAKLLMATLFPEVLDDESYILIHKNEMSNLAKRLHVRMKSFPPKWTHYMVRREWIPPSLEGRRDEDILMGNIVRFR